MVRQMTGRTQVPTQNVLGLREYLFIDQRGVSLVRSTIMTYIHSKNDFMTSVLKIVMSVTSLTRLHFPLKRYHHDMTVRLTFANYFSHQNCLSTTSLLRQETHKKSPIRVSRCSCLVGHMVNVCNPGPRPKHVQLCHLRLRLLWRTLSLSLSRTLSLSLFYLSVILVITMTMTTRPVDSLFVHNDPDLSWVSECMILHTFNVWTKNSNHTGR